MFLSRTLRLFRPEAVLRTLAPPCYLHTSASQLNSNRATIACIPRQKFARVYPVLMVRPDGSTIHIRYKEPKRILMMPIDINTLPEAQRKARLRRREVSKIVVKEDVQFEDDFSLDDYRKFWKKK
ncbi:large ribosomal subunit protein mL55 [Heteronotia binoei]|uniref:large ribosomal subunit protein mL55 n=1 Tax=Heteronotia binoei TaxID=13085 RepID=UPI0029309035|nr:large ribosomal subunit protein mL55 [Heteronotia binoei]XP_060103912.1 large ribosomal subunit protein mL55 [Heteronotia binoei]XP_060103913.1 large ribosomal subunit protein mL55 [Heteronotia binoei]XP_060103914.1 large ribosomal subunit protein mL55 [Heteronotia binoei]XP_060103915.1 large ribosomal subunit protein mL55 [Heteronotia binoei]